MCSGLVGWPLYGGISLQSNEINEICPIKIPCGNVSVVLGKPRHSLASSSKFSVHTVSHVATTNLRAAFVATS